MEQKYHMFCISLLFFNISLLFCMDGEYIEKNTKGEVIFNNVIGYIKDQKNKKLKRKVIKHVSSNIIDVSIWGIEDRLDGIYESLGLFSCCARWLSYLIFNINTAKEQMPNVKRDVEKILIKDSKDSKKVICEQKYSWLQDDFDSFKSQDNIENRRKVFEIFCLGVHIAVHNEKEFKDILEKASFTNRFSLHDRMYKALVEDIPALEARMEQDFLEQEKDQ